MLEFIFSHTFLAYLIGFNLGVLAGAILTAFRRAENEGVGRPVCLAEERAARQAGPGGHS